MTLKNPTALTVLAGVVIVICATVLAALHVAVPQWLPYLAVFLFGHGAGASAAGAIFNTGSSPPTSSTTVATAASVPSVASTTVAAATTSPPTAA